MYFTAYIKAFFLHLSTHRNLQKSLSPRPTVKTDVSSGSAPAAQLTKSVLDQYEKQQREPTVTSRVTDSVKVYLQTLEDSGHNSPTHPAHHQPHKLPYSFPNQWKKRQDCSPKSLEVHTLTKDTTVGGVSQEVEQRETAFVPLQVQPAPIPQKPSPIQGKGHAGLTYLGLAFNKLGISNGLPALNYDPSTDFLPRPDSISSQLKQLSEAAENPAELSQSQHARRRLHMGEASVYTGRPSAYENSFSSCDIKSLASDWSVNSWSTFNTRDEQEFRNGLAALDASIASLQRTLKADLKR